MQGARRNAAAQQAEQSRCMVHVSAEPANVTKNLLVRRGVLDSFHHPAVGVGGEALAGGIGRDSRNSESFCQGLPDPGGQLSSREDGGPMVYLAGVIFAELGRKA